MTGTVARFLASPLGLSLTAVFLTILSVIPPLAFGLRSMDPFANLVQAAAAILCLIIVPLLIVRYLFKGNPADYGWRLPEKGSKPVATTLLVLVPLVLLMAGIAHAPGFKEYYERPLSAEPGILFVMFLVPAAYYAAEEFLFRGFLLMPLWRSLRLGGIALSLALFTLLHLGKPALELALAALIGVLLCWLSLRTKSFVPAAIVHYVIAVALNVLVSV